MPVGQSMHHSSRNICDAGPKLLRAKRHFVHDRDLHASTPREVAWACLPIAHTPPLLSLNQMC